MITFSFIVPLLDQPINLLIKGILITYLLLAPIGRVALGQASLAAEDTIDDLVVDVDGVAQSFTVVRDARRRSQWYYVPTSPRLSERSFQGSKEPEFALVRYQFSNPANPAQLLEGGVLQFAATTAIPESALLQLKAALKAKVSGEPGADLQIAAMPIKSCRVSLLAPAAQLLVSNQQGGGLGPTISTQKVAFTVDLTSPGADVFEALVNGNTGVPVHVEFTYQGLTPKAGFRVVVDWDKTYLHYSTDERFRARASYFGLVGASASIDRTEIANTLRSAKCLEVQVIEGEGFSEEKMKDYLQPILKRINDELLEEMKPPAQVPPAQVGAPRARGFFGGVGYSVAMKKVSDVKHGTEVVDFSVQKIVERSTVADGFIGIGAYPKAIRDKLVVSAASGFKSSYFLLPAIGDRVGVDQVNIEISHKGGQGVTPVYTAIWTKGSGWVYADKSAYVIPIPLTGLPASLAGVAPENLNFSVKTVIVTAENQVFETVQEHDVFNGRRATSPPISLADVVEVDGTALPWRNVTPMDPSAKLVAVDIGLKCGNQSLTRTMRAKLVGGIYQAPDILTFLIPKNTGEIGEPVTARITFKFVGGRPPLDWSQNGKNLRDAGLSVILDPADWPAEGVVTNPTNSK